jgi:prolipoprotein diacylglyceryltransferase
VRRVLFHWRGIRVWSYPACLYAGVNVGILAQNRAAHAAGVDAWRVYLATLLLLPAAVAGSRLLFVAGNWRHFARDPARMWRRAGGGMSMLGGVPVMLAVSVPLLAALDLPFWRFWDLSTFCILAAMSCTRVGCLLNGCCAGRPARALWALNLPNVHGVWAPRHPTQILEGMVALTLFALAAVAYPFVAHHPGVLFLIVAGVYGAVRLGLQPLREDRERLGPLDVQQLMSGALIVLSSVGLMLIVR